MKWVLRTLGLIALVPICVWAWFYFGFGILPQTVGTVKINSLELYDKEETATEDSTFVLNINYYSNKNNTDKAKQLFEIMFTTYLGNDTNNIFSKGIQIYGDDLQFGTKFWETVETGFLGMASHTEWYKIVPEQKTFYYDQSYEGEEDEPFSIANSLGLSNDYSFMISVGTTPLKLNFKNQTRMEHNTFYDKSFGHIFGNKDFYSCFSIDVNYFIYHILQNTKSLDEGTHIVTLDLSNFFDCYLYNEETLQYDKLTADTEFTYIQAKINVNNDGCTTKNQSLFKKIANNDETKYDESSSSSLFWKTINNVALSNKDFDIDSNGYLTLKRDVANRLILFSDIRVKIEIQVDETTKGFSKNCFNYLKKIYSIELNSNTARQFEVYKTTLSDDIIITLNNVELVEVSDV